MMIQASLCIEDDDADAPFHDATGRIGKWVQMIQTPRKPQASAQYDYQKLQQSAQHSRSPRWLITTGMHNL